ncbi:MAG: type IV secretory system conjugative DNA transfer family protein [Enterococcus sp.]|nr:type IV secretory system conjugative DNA transfer family protein [Enterococcus sp.]
MDSFKQVFFNLLIIIAFISSFVITNKIDSDGFQGVLNGEFSVFKTLGIFLIIHLVLLVVIRAYYKNKSTKLADSKLLKPSDLKKEQKRMQNEGIFYSKPRNKNKNHPYYKDKSALPLSRNVKLSTKASYTHTILFGPTGSGKSAAFFIPILKAIDGNSIIVTDPKGELHAKTKNYLEYKGYEVLHLNFNDPSKSDFYSLLGSCKDHSEVNKLAESIMSNGSGGGGDDNWAKMSKPLFAAFLFHEYDKGEKLMSNVTKSLGEVGADANALEAYFEFSSPKAKESYLMFKGSMGSEATVGSIFTTINGKVEVFTYDKVQLLSEKSSFSADNFRLGKAALFVSYPEDEAVVYSPYIASFFYQIMSSIKAHPSMYEGSGGEKGNGVHFLLDEFANIGTLPELDTFLSTIRSKEMSVMLGIQSFDQIKVRYKDRTNTIVENCKTKIVLPGTTGQTAKFFSELVGEEQYKSLSTSTSKNRDTSVSEAEQKKMILSQDQIRRMKTHDVIFVSDNLKPVQDIKNLYYITDFEQKIFAILPFSEKLNLKIAKSIATKIGANKETDAFEIAVKKFAQKNKKAKSKIKDKKQKERENINIKPSNEFIPAIERKRVKNEPYLAPNDLDNDLITDDIDEIESKEVEIDDNFNEFDEIEVPEIDEFNIEDEDNEDDETDYKKMLEEKRRKEILKAIEDKF